MANPFKHKDVGTQLTRTEWEDDDAHEVSGATDGDIIRYNSASGYWETCVEPFEFDHIKLTPKAVAPTPIEGGLYYDSVEKALYIGVDE